MHEFLATTTTPVDWAQTGVIGGLVLSVIATGVKKKWLFYWVHEQIVEGLRIQLAVKTKEGEEWKRLALRQAGIVEQTVDRAAEVVYRTVKSADAGKEGVDARLAAQLREDRKALIDRENVMAERERLMAEREAHERRSEDGS